MYLVSPFLHLAHAVLAAAVLHSAHREHMRNLHSKLVNGGHFNLKSISKSKGKPPPPVKSKVKIKKVSVDAPSPSKTTEKAGPKKKRKETPITDQNNFL